MTEDEALESAFERAGGLCECIGGGCPSLSHRPGVNRCSAALGSLSTTAFFTIGRFADRKNPENICVYCAVCAATPRRHGQRLPAPAATSE